ncbi:MAG: lipid A export permease/ATP-binding protein MsbA [Proteobacteria bacterium]|nr:lipid A export permease/ATP-binding protein MsbA [Pseudomonadota bacterium]
MRYARPFWRVFLLGVVGMAISAAVETAWMWLAKEFLDGTFFNHDPHTAVLVPVAIVAIFFVRGIGDYVAQYAPGWVGRQVVKRLRADLFRHYLDLPSAFYDRNASAQLLSRLTYNTELVAEATTNSLTVLIRDTLAVAGLLTWAFMQNARFTAIALLAAPVIGLLVRVVNRAISRYAARIQSSMGDVTRVAKEALDGQRVIKVFNAQDHEARDFEQVIEANRRQNMKLLRARAASNPTVQMIAALSLAGVLYLAIRDVFAHGMTPGSFSSLIGALIGVANALKRLVQVFGPLQQGIAAGQSVFEMLDEPAEPGGGDRPLGRARGEVEWQGVTFAYPGKAAALSDFSLRVAPGEMVAFVGRSGSGKSTLVGLVARFYDVEQGSVRVDGHDVRDYPLRELRANVSLVSQDVVLMDGTIRDNIVFSTVGADQAAIERAARAAHVLEFANALPQGLDTPVGDRGAMLSGGQRQRIAIARALLKDAPILILDEATSALDTEAERIIQEALVELMRDRTTLVIAHRLSTIEHADRIVVLDGGRIVESGAHAELLARGGAYAALHRRQFAD